MPDFWFYIMTNSVTHFEIYAEEPAKLVEFYRTLLGWQIHKAPGVDYWRIQTAPADPKGINGGLTFCPIPGRAVGCITSTSSHLITPSSKC